VIPVDDSGQVLLDEYRKLLKPHQARLRDAGLQRAGHVVPVKRSSHGPPAGAVLVDGAQSVSHMRVNVQALDADFFVFSGHKIFGPTGIGVVYGKRRCSSMPPWQGGGNMIADVTFEKTVFQPAPNRSKPAPATSPTRWAWARRSTTSSASAWRTSPATSTTCWCATRGLSRCPACA
jgi:cysteine desulfurase/selenocysteine lyase